jgi:hypothetical protein
MKTSLAFMSLLIWPFMIPTSATPMPAGSRAAEPRSTAIQSPVPM